MKSGDIIKTSNSGTLVRLIYKLPKEFDASVGLNYDPKDERWIAKTIRRKINITLVVNVWKRREEYVATSLNNLI